MKKAESTGPFARNHPQPYRRHSLRLNETTWEVLVAIARSKRLDPASLLEAWARGVLELPAPSTALRTLGASGPLASIPPQAEPQPAAPVPESSVISEERFRYLVHHSTDYVSVLQSDGTRCYVSPSVERILGYKAWQLLGREAFDFIHPEDAPRVKAIFAQALQKPGINIAVEFRGRRADGSWIYLESIGNNQLDNPQVRGFLINTRDITERKEAERLRLEELNQRNQIKDEFLRTVSHELRLPMTGIKLAAEMMRGSTSQAECEDYLSILEAECDREMELITTLLDLQQLEAKAQPLLAVPVVLHEWLPGIVEPFRLRTACRHQQLNVQIDSVPILTTDPGSLERILRELLNNACKYTPPGDPIVLTATSVSMQAVRLSVCNWGTEIPGQELERIFEKFYRVPGADLWQQGGTGLGLCLVKELVEQLGGSLEVKSQLGYTNFSVDLPVAAAARPAPRLKASQPGRSPHTKRPSTRLAERSTTGQGL